MPFDIDRIFAMKNFLVIAVALGFAVGCGGGDDDVLLREATVEDAKDLCEFANDHIPEETDCGGGVTAGGGEPEDCDAISGENDTPATCDATIGDAKDCIEALEADPCSDSFPAACAPIFSADCLGGMEDVRVHTLQRLRAIVNSSTSR